MIVIEHDSVEVDHCTACGGIWLDAGEIELLFGDAVRCHGFLRGGDRALAKGERPRRCPICGKKMGKDVSRGERPVTYDRCPAGDGLWFDKGELAQILCHAEGFAHSGIPQFLSQVFSGHPSDNLD